MLIATSTIIILLTGSVKDLCHFLLIENAQMVVVGTARAYATTA